LTDWGAELEPVLLHLGQWGVRAPLPDGARVGLPSVLLALQANIDPVRVPGRFQLRIGADAFTVDTTTGSARFRREIADESDATVTTDADTFRAVVFGQREIDDAVRAGELRLDGDPAAIGRLTDLLMVLCRTPVTN
jgi:hypothetical protein